MFSLWTFWASNQGVQYEKIDKGRSNRYGMWMRAELKLKTLEEVKFMHAGNGGQDGDGVEFPGQSTTRYEMGSHGAHFVEEVDKHGEVIRVSADVDDGESAHEVAGGSGNVIAIPSVLDPITWDIITRPKTVSARETMNLPTSPSLLLEIETDMDMCWATKTENPITLTRKPVLGANG